MKQKKLAENFSLSNPERILYPEAHITKLMIAEYYAKIADWILPYISNRPLTLVRCPQDYKHKCFYQKHLHDAEIEYLYRIPIKEKSTTDDYIYLKNQQGLMSLVQLSVLEIHPWGARVDEVEKPDMMIFDLDPAPDVAWKEVVKAAFLMKSELEKLRLVSFLKTTGGKGLHVVVPLKRLYSWDEIKGFSHAVVDYIVADYPKNFLSNMNKAKRHGKIFLDYLRNGRGATAIAPYSTRARENATVATPLFWEELTPKLNPAKFTIKTVPARLAKLKADPWQDFYQSCQSIKALKSLLKKA